MFGWLKRVTTVSRSANADRVAFTADEFRRSVDLGLQLATNSGIGFSQQMAAMDRAGFPASLASRVINMIPILAGRRFLAESGPKPAVADHYLLVDPVGNERAVRLSDCPVCSAVESRLGELAPDAIMLIGMCSCEVQAFNDALNMIGPNATDADIASIRIEPPQMGGSMLTIACS